MKKYLFLIFLFPFACLGQSELKVSRQAQLCYSNFDDVFFVIDDSTGFFTYNSKIGKWKRHPLTLELSDGYVFEEFKRRFSPMAVGKSHYLFVQDGCGMVYELKNDTLKRIDKSFDQRHQFFSAMYAEDGIAYMFGGYGLFTSKNTHTYFDIQTKEWYQVQHKGIDYPPARNSPLQIKTNHGLYVLGGYEKRLNQDIVLNDIWYFNFKSKKWQLLGQLNSSILEHIGKINFIQNRDYHIFASENHLFTINPQNNHFATYQSNRYFNIHSLITDKKREFVLIASHGTAEGKEAFLNVKKLKNILYGQPIEAELFNSNSWWSSLSYAQLLWGSVILNFLLIILVVYIRRGVNKNKTNPRQRILRRSDFTDSEWEILQLVSNNNELELSSINSYFDEPGLSFETLKKRRESFIRSLRNKMANLTNIQVDKLLVEKKHTMDKRMKIICWNKELSFESEK